MKNTTILHAEDLMLHGKRGMGEIFSFFSELQKIFSGTPTKKIKTSLKWDGSPSIVCGINPENRKFFIGTKGVFNKIPILNYTLSDIKKNYKNNKNLSYLLSSLLVELSKLGIDGIYQGDLLFWPSLVRKRSINHQKHLTFKPNTITYSVVNSSKLGKKINSSKFGIVFHTKYSGRKISKLRPEYGPDISNFAKNKNIWAIDSSYTNISLLTNGEKNLISSEMKLIKNVGLEPFLDELEDQNYLTSYLNKYFNHNVKNNIKEDSLDSFLKWLSDKIEDEKLKLKTIRGKRLRDDKRKVLFDFINDHDAEIRIFFKIRRKLLKIKNIFISRINNTDDINTFFDIDGNLKETQPEGLVVVDGKNKIIKLIDRLEFSRNNFIAWGNKND
jgi:hypothetical protein